MKGRAPFNLTAKGMMIIRQVVALITAAALIFSVTAVLVNNKQEPAAAPIEPLKLSAIKNIPEGSLYIEWLGARGYDADNPTMILFHGETPDRWDSKFDMVLPESDYVYYSSSSTNYNVTRNLDIERTLHQYWLNQGYNLGIFHWEKFADDDAGKLVKKLYNAVDMRYKTAADAYEEDDIPDYSMTEVAAAAYLDSIPAEAYGNEIRFVGNGVGGCLALSVADYLYTAFESGILRQEVLPHRLTLVDPYLAPDGFSSDAKWRPVPTQNGMPEAVNEMLRRTSEMGLAAELIENVEVGLEVVNGVSGEKLTSPYDYTLEPQQAAIKREIQAKTAYLLLRQQYSKDYYTDSYRAQNRAGLDWYLNSIRGSDDDSIGYPTGGADYSSSYCNWGRNNTRPIINDCNRNNQSSRGKNYAVGAWTDTVWIRALKGIEFRMQKFSNYLEDDEKNIIKDIHGVSMYTYTDYTLERFRSENYQRAVNMDKTIVAGYVFNDKNEDRVMNDGVASRLSGVTINVLLTVSVEGETQTVENYTVKTGRDGFYLLTFDRSFTVSHSLTLTVVPKDSSVHMQTAALNTYHVQDLNKHTFTKNKKTLSLTSSYGNAITMANCGLVIK